jgi:hypothetical protein
MAITKVFSASITAAMTATMAMVDDVSGEQVQDVITAALKKTLTDGTGANKGEVLYTEGNTLAASANKAYDLSGTLAGKLGNVTFTNIKVILVFVTTLDTGAQLDVGGGSTPIPLFKDPTDIYQLGPGGIFQVVEPVDGIAVTAATADLLKIANPDDTLSVDYVIAIIGEGTLS